MAAPVEYTGDEFTDQAKRVIVSQQLPFYHNPRALLGFSVRPQRIRPHRMVLRADQTINQPSGHRWQVYRRGDRTMTSSALTSITFRGEAYVVSGSPHVDETRISFGDALLLALDWASVIGKTRGY